MLGIPPTYTPVDTTAVSYDCTCLCIIKVCVSLLYKAATIISLYMYIHVIIQLYIIVITNAIIYNCNDQ